MSNVLSLPIDPIRSWQRRARLTWMISSLAVVGCAIWTFLPLKIEPAEPIKLEIKSPNQDSPAKPDRLIEPQVFAVNLWNAPSPPPEPKTSKSEPVKPLNIQLIGIIREDASGKRMAAIYDVDRDQLLILSSGDRVREHTVTSINDNGIELSDGRSTRRLKLDPEASS